MPAWLGIPGGVSILMTAVACFGQRYRSQLAGASVRIVCVTVSDMEISRPSGSRQTASLIPSSSRIFGSITNLTFFALMSRYVLSRSVTLNPIVDVPAIISLGADGEAVRGFDM